MFMPEGHSDAGARARGDRGDAGPRFGPNDSDSKSNMTCYYYE